MLTDVDGQITDGREEDFDVGTSDEFWVHSSRVLEQSASQETLGARSHVSQIE